MISTLALASMSTRHGRRLTLPVSEARKQGIPDVDAIDDSIHGREEGRFFHGVMISIVVCRSQSSAVGIFLAVTGQS